MASFDELRKKIEPFGRSALRLSESEAPGFSKFGGAPSVPDEFEWPMWNGRPLAFLLQLRLSDINGEGSLPELPASGLLYVFYDGEQSTWGFAPEDRGSWRVMFFEETDALETRRPPEGLDTRYQEKYVCAKPVVTYPPAEDDCIAELLDDAEAFEKYDEMRYSVYDDEPTHHLGGYCDPVQDAEMDLDCQLVANGLRCGDETAYRDERRCKEMKAGRAEWALLLQIDTDDDADMMWGDCGILYFWIHKSDLKSKNFDRVWMILQCY